MSEANERNQEDKDRATATVAETSWEHGGFLNQEFPEDQPHPDLRSLSMDETMNMSRRQIKNWLAYREGIEQGINDTNRIELKKVANSLRNRLFDIIKNIHPWPTALTKDAMR